MMLNCLFHLLHHHHHLLLLLHHLSLLLFMVHSSVQNSTDVKQQSIISKLKDNNEFVKVIESIEDTYQIYLNRSKTFKDCFNNQSSVIKQRLLDHPEEKCFEFIPHDDKDNVINFGDSGSLNSFIDTRVSNIYWMNIVSFENKYLTEIAKEISHQSKTLKTETEKPEDLLNISTTATTATLIPSTITKRILIQNVKPTNKVINSNISNTNQINEVNTVKNEIIKNYTQSSLSENSSFEGYIYLIYLLISIVLAIFIIGAVYFLCTHSKTISS
ncbi:unnamed protein product [Schistosoma bovis]|nr:unnamed protein product [Schistosoma bovis]